MQKHRPAPNDYDEDFFAWSQHQASLLRAAEGRRAGVPDGLDLPHLAEEIEDLGKSELRGATSLIRNIFVHLIKAASDPTARAVGHWRTETTTFHNDLPRFYAPSMRQLIDLQELWTSARAIGRDALREYGASIAPTIPETSPFALQEILAKGFHFDEAVARLRDHEG